MNYLPIFLNMKNKKVLVIGGGEVAHRKVLSLLKFTKDIMIVSSHIKTELKKTINKYSLTYLQDNYNSKYLEKIDILIVAVDDLKLQKNIYEETKDKKIMCNFSDFEEYCDFILPSYIKKDDLVVCVSTMGSAPAFAKEFKKYIEKLIPNDIDCFLKQMKDLRTTLPKGKKRMDLLRQKAQKYIQNFKQ
ncbi:siroheme synthase [Malaciobacter marinus]|uniref:precorrin-2 dehydrogenase/sirohydrochlorin ferrochelatase family protein n=1 Tax=Malaciobacter marinus TaxID=505249 RepID=UPI000C069738|nr:bifunctional precorrin-2 dehydrogenase/sirohydrochlorin ferrochelatase [Malaciobacter marinus]PHO13565.1 siroheme synthase [Malaciobacter marinus]